MPAATRVGVGTKLEAGDQMRSLCVLPILFLLTSCGGAVHVTYDRDHCSLDGHSVTFDEVQAQQSRLSRRVLQRQPIQTAVTILMLLLAGAGYIDKLALLIAARRTSAPSFGERVRLALERHRPHPVRYFAIVTTGLVLIGIGAGFYIYLDADKRASERALQQLQFCQLALKTGEEQVALDEQRQNLDRLQETAGSIKTLVDGLPPEAQRKAEALLGEVKRSLGNQARLLSNENAVERAVASGSAQIEQHLGALQADVGGLKTMPQRLQDQADLLARIEARTRLDTTGNGGTAATLGETLSGINHKTDEWGARLLENDCTKARLSSGKTIGEALLELTTRPTVICRCELPVVAASRDGGTK